jgi:hypothetical protein
MAGQEQVLGERELAEQADFLVDRRQSQRAARRAGSAGGSRGRRARCVPESARSAPVRTRKSVLFPAPFSPTSAWISPAARIEIDAVEGAHAAVGLGDALARRTQRQGADLPLQHAGRRRPARRSTQSAGRWSRPE